MTKRNNPTYWSVEPEWKGETAYIVAGGPSVLDQDLSLLKGQKVIVINSSYMVYPDANFLIFADVRWWNQHHARVRSSFKGRVVSASRHADGPGILRIGRATPPPALSSNPTVVPVQWTTLQGAINLCVHLGVNRIVLLGADMSRATDGRTHHHDPHPWKNKEGNKTWDVQMKFLREMAEPIAKIGVQVINTSMSSRIDWWPKQSLEDALANTPPPPVRRRIVVKESREFDMLKRRNFKDYSGGHQQMYMIPIKGELAGKQWNIFEAGVGIGWGLDQMIKAGVVGQYVGVEPNVDSFNYSHSRHRKNPLVTLINMPFGQQFVQDRLALERRDGAPFDYAFCVEVIEHVHPDLHLDFLRGLHSLAPRLWFSTPDVDKVPKEGVRTTAEWVRLLHEAGFGSVDVTTKHWTYLYQCAA